MQRRCEWRSPPDSTAMAHTSMPGENLDLTSDPDPRSSSPADDAGRRYIGVTFACCDVYARVYINREESAYVGNCPKCAKRLNIRIGPGGTEQRFFTAY